VPPVCAAGLVLGVGVRERFWGPFFLRFDYLGSLVCAWCSLFFAWVVVCGVWWLGIFVRELIGLC